MGERWLVRRCAPDVARSQVVCGRAALSASVPYFAASRLSGYNLSRSALTTTWYFLVEGILAGILRSCTVSGVLLTGADSVELGFCFRI